MISSRSKPYAGSTGGGVGLQSAASPADQAQRADPVSPLGMGDADAELGESLPQLPLRVGTCFPARLVHLMG